VEAVETKEERWLDTGDASRVPEAVDSVEAASGASSSATSCRVRLRDADAAAGDARLSRWKAEEGVTAAEAEAVDGKWVEMLGFANTEDGGEGDASRGEDATRGGSDDTGRSGAITEADNSGMPMLLLLLVPAGLEGAEETAEETKLDDEVEGAGSGGASGRGDGSAAVSVAAAAEDEEEGEADATAVSAEEAAAACSAAAAASLCMTQPAASLLTAADSAATSGAGREATA
jgi:hypothetical protein